MFRLRGKGIKGVRSTSHGDLHCHVVVETPVNLTDRQKELLREFEAISQNDSERHNPRAKSWMGKVKDFFRRMTTGLAATGANILRSPRPCPDPDTELQFLTMPRLKAFSVHLAISAAIAASVIGLMLLLWYRPPFFSALGGQHILLILLGVDVVLGPVFTLMIFNPGKSRRALTFDLSVIAILQAAALIYGTSVMFQARPVFVVFSRDSFDLVTANMLSGAGYCPGQNPDYRSLPLTGPVYVYSELPTDIKERNEVVLGAFSGKDLPQFPQYYMPYKAHMATVGQAARPIAELKKLNPEHIADIDDAVRASGRAESDVGFVPMRAKYRDETVLVGKSDGNILGLLPTRPWLPTVFIPQQKN